MKLLLFLTQKDEIFPVAAKTMVSGPESVSSGSTRWARIRRQVQQVYQRLKEKLDYHENLCSQLRHLETAEIYHPDRLKAEEAQKKLRDFLKLRYSKHSRWLCVDALLAFLGIFLMPVPGPNVFFFYPAARTLGHYFARQGSRKLLRTSTLSFHREPLIDEIQEHLDDLEAVDNQLRELESRYGVQKLATVLTALKNG